ncbi:HlyD family efflux transporter periplasmic adaptor subunit [Streptomyces sp. NBC_01142]|uniref:HlyD family efflux transporter periplasmic adaptor subunit n=1 Tax=Streptomyces sp. NBC_01142 TaxID=2975865 RepID=UPI00224CCCFF|nr:HlyD family secretion protein [Streptomyces sp. NBC_01142]MCX4826221.1 HlyD family efflux transporter periplasmic adaptor subunit [Streptomyces sp. NBC_01142]
MDESRLVWDAGNILTAVQTHVLSGLRAEHMKVDLDSAIGMRQNAYIATYSEPMVGHTRRVYFDNPTDQSAVLHRLIEELEIHTKLQSRSLDLAYQQDGLFGQAVKKAFTDTTFSGIVREPTGDVRFENTSKSVSEAKGFEYRIPSDENAIRSIRARIGQRQELLSAMRMRALCERPETFTNELAALDAQVRKLQVAYIDTLLVSPIPGVVTGVFRNTGDFVSAGQPVVRVEDDSAVYLVGTIKYRGMLKLNSQVAVTTKLFDDPVSQQTRIEGSVTSIRGHDSVDEQWEVLVRCSNRTPSGAPILPLNYNFDFDSTIVEVASV